MNEPTSPVPVNITRTWAFVLAAWLLSFVSATCQTPARADTPRTHPLGVAAWQWLGENATDIQLRGIDDVPGTPSQAVTSISGMPWTENGEKGNLRVEIICETQQEFPGISEDALQQIEAALADGNAVLADMSRKNWRGRAGELTPEETPKQPPAPVRVCILRAEPDGRFVLATGPRGEIARIGRAELRRATCSAAAAIISWVSKKSDAEPFPKDFDYKTTLIKPGHHAYLALPFLDQDPGGICTAAASLNVAKYLDPKLDIKQREVFALFNRKSSGATMGEVVAGLETLGFDAEFIQTDKADRLQLLAKIQASLDEGRPIIATIPGHALTIIGYCKTTRTIIVWDQRMNKKGRPAYLPDGGFELSEAAYKSRIDSVTFVRKSWAEASAAERATIASMRPCHGELRRHQIVKGTGESFLTFLNHAATPKIKAVINAGRTPLVPTGRNKLVEIQGENAGKWKVTHWPDGKTTEQNASYLARILDANDGVFYSTETAVPQLTPASAQLDHGPSSPKSSQSMNKMPQGLPHSCSITTYPRHILLQECVL